MQSRETAMNDMPGADSYRAIAARLKLPSLAFIDGKFRPAASGRVFENINPATGEVLGTVAHCDAADVDAAVGAARRVFEGGTWSRAAPEARKEVLLKLANLVRTHKEELATLESLDSGKTITDCLHEIGNEVPTFFQWYAELIDKSFGKVAPTAETALRLAELAAEAGLPAGVLNVLPGYGETAGQAIGRHAGIDVVSFTGSTEVGAYFLKYASESNLKPVGLEMGGKSPFIVLEDAEITDDLIANAVSAACWNGGQNCSANMRQIVHAKVKDVFLGKVLESIRALKVGDPLDPATQMGSMITEEHQRRVLGYIAKGEKEGAKILQGSAKPMDRAGYYVAPTVFDKVAPSMTIAREEIFGPVLGVIPATSFEEALKIATDTDYGLHATIFTKDIDRALYLARRLPCGTVSINKFTEGDVKTPFGGYRKSGSLARDNGAEALDQYLQTKTIWINVTPPS